MDKNICTQNILEASIVRVTMAGGATEQASLPEICAALMRDEIDAFPALRPPPTPCLARPSWCSSA